MTDSYLRMVLDHRPMDVLPQLVISLAAAYGYAACAWLLLRQSARVGPVISVTTAIVVLLCPLIIPADHVKLRALSAFLCADLMFKMVDCWRTCRRGIDDCSAGKYFRFLIPFPILLVVMHHRDRWLVDNERSRGWDLLRATIGTALFAACFAMLHVVAGISTVRAQFALDHGIKLVLFTIAIESIAQAMHGLERLVGLDTKPPIRNAFVSRTVAEFWWRYNTRIHDWLDHNVFRPSGGRRAPIRGVFLVLLVSGLLHEVMFAIATSRIDGYQLSFFVLQGPAVLASPWLARGARRFGRAGVAGCWLLTVVWFYFTSMLFFHGMNRVFPFYYASDPWLP